MKNRNYYLLKKNLLEPRISESYKKEYELRRFRSNIIRMLIITIALFVDQLVFGLFVAEDASALQLIYFITATVMMIYFLISLYFIYHIPAKINWIHKLFELSFAVIGLGIALSRVLLVKTECFTVPSVYVAALYMLAILFVFGRVQIILIYTVITTAALVLIPFFHPSADIYIFRADVISFAVVACLIMFMNRRRQLNSFLDKKHIETINQELLEQSIRDGLTGLYNRRKLDEVLGEVCLKASRYANDFSVIMIDLDHFKQVNDNYGHHIGDTVLQEFSRILEENIREVDVCGRWGGEEFLIICQETELSSAVSFAERIRHNIEKSKFSNDLKITASFGVSSWSESVDEADLLRKADERLYKAKRGGRNMVCAAHDC